MTPPGYRALMVDDNRAAATSLGFLLDQASFEVRQLR